MRALLALLLIAAGPARTRAQPPAVEGDALDAPTEDGADAAVPEPPPEVELRPSTVQFRVTGAEGAEVLVLSDPILDDSGAGGLVVRRSPEARYQLLCEAPCRVELPQSHFGLAVRHRDATRRFDEPLGVDGPTRVDLTFVDQADLRLAGVLLLAIGVPLGLVTGATLLVYDLTANDELGVAGGVGLGVGGGVLAASAALGLVFTLYVSDEWRFDAVPLPADAPGVYSEDF